MPLGGVGFAVARPKLAQEVAKSLINGSWHDALTPNGSEKASRPPGRYGVKFAAGVVRDREIAVRGRCLRNTPFHKGLSQ